MIFSEVFLTIGSINNFDVCYTLRTLLLGFLEVGEAVSSDNGDSGFHDIGGRCDDSSASECDDVAVPGPVSEPSSDGSLISDTSSGGVDSVHALRSTRDPLAWIAARMQAGVDPRPLLEQLLPPNVRLPNTIERMTMWDIIIDLLGEEEEFHKPPRQRWV